MKQNAVSTGKWKRKPQECDGEYFFSGRFLITAGVQRLLSDDEIRAIYLEIQSLVQLHNGLDYLQVYVHEDTEQKLFFIDQLNTEMIQSGEFREEDNHCTLLLAEEY